MGGLRQQRAAWARCSWLRVEYIRRNNAQVSGRVVIGLGRIQGLLGSSRGGTRSWVGAVDGWLAGNGVTRSRLLELMREMEGAIALSRSWGSRYRRGSPRERARATGSEAWIRCLG
jgi:hypothetical protein